MTAFNTVINNFNSYYYYYYYILINIYIKKRGDLEHEICMFKARFS